LNESQSNRDNAPLIEDRLGLRARVFGTERAILVGIDTGRTDHPVEHWLRELEALTDTAGIEVLGSVVQARNRPSPATFIGKGKVDEVRLAAEELEADVVIFNDELSPAQARNLEGALGRKVVDRTQLILDIFAQRAATKEAKLQVELAQLHYLLPRLRGWGMALTRAGGGIGTRGPGETQLELDRFKINRRIHALEKRLKKTGAEREVRRKKRSRNELPQIALVGYTNSGKSTLLNRLAQADALVEDKLFATLDTVVRRGELSPGRSALFIDTVGFIRALPHDLVPAFAATLEAARYADLILHVTDIGVPSWKDDYRAVIDTLEEEVFGDAEDERPPILDVYNKMDTLVDGRPVPIDGVAISAATGEQIEVLLQEIVRGLYGDNRTVELMIPFAQLGALHRILSPKRIEQVEHTEHGVHIRATVSPRELGELHAAGAELISSSSGAVPGEES